MNDSSGLATTQISSRNYTTLLEDTREAFVLPRTFKANNVIMQTARDPALASGRVHIEVQGVLPHAMQ